MKIFLDTANIQDIKDLIPTGLINGVTTNPSLIAQSGRSFRSVIKEISEIVAGPVSAEVVSETYDEMVQEGKELAKISPNVIVKLPLTMDGLRACRHLSYDGIGTNVTLCFSPAQALLAAKSGASFVSPFVGRLDDISTEGLFLVGDIINIFDQYENLTTEILVASARHPMHVVEAAKMGADAVTIPPKVFHQLYHHPLTDKGLEIFAKDWQKVYEVL